MSYFLDGDRKKNLQFIERAAISSIALATIVIVVIIVVAGGAYYFVSSNSSTTTSASSTTSSTAISSSSSTVSSSASPSGLILYSADAYVNESTILENGFSTSTGIQMAPPKAAGSLTLAQQIAQGNPVSVFLSVSKTAIQNATLKSAFGGWAVAFATDQMGIAYTNATLQNSAGAAVVNAFNTAVSTNSTTDWYNFYNNLTSGQVKVGISNPNADPAGYRAWIVLEAAGHIYAGNNSGYFVNRLISNSGNYTGASAADLVAPLQTGQIQFLFIYKSDITAEHLRLLQLPKGVNLGSGAYNTFYSQFTYTITSGVQKGGSITLWITVPKTSTDNTNSVRFVVYVVQNYVTLLKPFGLSNIQPPKIYNDTSIPTPLQQLLTNGSLSYAGAL
ncbi:MAG: substrate-binding domain-containing protein [Thaumarchaeota archaeon]|nr:substrate-binding domain-containing protein [Nitrososphaerota archaeon]